MPKKTWQAHGFRAARAFTAAGRAVNSSLYLRCMYSECMLRLSVMRETQRFERKPWVKTAGSSNSEEDARMLHIGIKRVLVIVGTSRAHKHSKRQPQIPRKERPRRV